MKLHLHQQTTPYSYYGTDYFLNHPVFVPADYQFEFRRYTTTSVTTYNVLDDYLNYDHGLELTPGNTTSHRGNENGILYYAEYLILKRMLGESLDEDVEIFNRIVAGLQVEPGLYDRGASDKVRENPKRTISHDNISAIASASVLLETNHAKEIASYGLKNCFIYNNNQRGFRLPMNPRKLVCMVGNGQ